MSKKSKRYAKYNLLISKQRSEFWEIFNQVFCAILRKDDSFESDESGGMFDSDEDDDFAKISKKNPKKSKKLDTSGDAKSEEAGAALKLRER